MAAEGLKRPAKKETMTTELIHVALVGDKGVGKSLLARARACGTKYALKEMFQLHISQVWTYDNYRTSPEVQERSLCHVDGVNCTLKIFDTFGNRDVKRENVYSLADAIVICFSVSDKRSLQSVTKHWIHEIRLSCPAIPVILCACKVDLRYIYKDPKFLELQKSSFAHQMQKENLIYPESGKEVAKEIKAYYYETSSLVSYGVNDLFNNAIRAVLVAKRRSSFAFRPFKNVSIPHVQVPHAPPKPATPKIVCEKNENSNWLEEGRKKWLFDGEFSDATLIVGHQTFEIHRVFLAAASPLFENIFLSEEVNSEKNINISPCVCKKGATFFASNESSISKNSDSEEKIECSKTNKNLGRFVVTPITSNFYDKVFNENCYRTKLHNFPESDFNSSLETNASSISSSADELSFPTKVLKCTSKNSSDSGGEFDFNGASSTLFDHSKKSFIHLDDLSALGNNETKLIPSHHHINADEYYSTVGEDSGIKSPLKNMAKTAFIKTIYNFSARRLSTHSIYRKLEKNSCDLCKKFKNSTLISSSTLSSNLSLPASPILSIKRIVSGDDGHVATNYNLTKTSTDVFEIELDEKLVEPKVLQSLLNILYTGNDEGYEALELDKVLHVAKMLKFPDVVTFLSAKVNKVSSSLETVKLSLEKVTSETQVNRIRHLFLENDHLADVCFGLDDGQIFVHRCLLSMHCEVFTAMFTGHFYERQNKVVDFRDASRAAFKTVQEYLYTGSFPTSSGDWLGALELANRLCLNHLLLPLQQSIQLCFDKCIKNNQEVILCALNALKLSRLIKADPLAQWCLWYLSVEFENVLKNYKDDFENLFADDKEYIEHNKWPPEWYLRAVKDYNVEILKVSKKKSDHVWIPHPGGCFSFNLKK